MVGTVLERSHRQETQNGGSTSLACLESYLLCKRSNNWCVNALNGGLIVSNHRMVNKLVRDRIPDIIEQSGNRYKAEVMSETDYRRALRQKGIEEAQEVAAASPDELVEELADLL